MVRESAGVPLAVHGRDTVDNDQVHDQESTHPRQKSAIVIALPDSDASSCGSPPTTRIVARSHWGFADLHEIWRYRELLYFLTARDIKIRYKQTILGSAWAIMQPLSAVLVFVIFFGRLGGLADGVDNYTLFVLAGVLPWTFFSNAVIAAGNSLVGNERLVTKTYFPRVFLPMACVGASAFDFLIGLSLLALGFVLAGMMVSSSLLLAPLVLGLLAITAFGVGILFAALIVAQRDFRHVLTFGMQLWMFSTPCIYLSADKIGPTAQAWLPLNPVYGLLLNFRAAIIGGTFDLRALGLSTLSGLAIMLTGFWYFRRVERTLADTI
ncbi:MAG: ABC transporter permease [Bacteroidales bacterium]|nr:ABC transporter permease [Bacteroidales bacterium]